ncbi:MAG: hypothetical protein M2R45_04489 [Verrucomicrobia subdivision 3 bacterium]|nr:hypothetical protein [Limisphaerales bacterium]MCS1412667.1 hypothetical protein [Limisphaerales bacterium]
MELLHAILARDDRLQRMALGNIVFSGQDRLVPALVWWGLVAALLFFSYWRLNGSRGVKQICFCLKVLGFGLLLLCLLEPLWTEKRAKPGANYMAILADNSQGMQIRDQGALESRGEQLLHLLVDELSSWRVQLETHFQVRRYIFDTRLHGIKSFGDLRFDGRASGLGSALRSLAQRFEGQPLAGILLFSDGNATDLVDGELDLTGLPPVYPVISGTDDRVRDISIQNVAMTETAFEDAPVTITAEIGVNGFKGGRVSAKLVPTWNDWDESDSVADKERQGGFDLEEQVQEVSGERTTLNFRFQFRPEKIGVSFYQLQVALVNSEEPATLGAAALSEATLANNQRVLVVNRSGGPYRILYVAGRPHWEYKFLNRALDEDDQVQLVGLIRLAKRSPRFEFKGRRGETSNPLYRGFDKQDDLTEQRDQPVLTRLNIRDESELVGGFPKKAEDLYGYAAIIVDDLEAGFFTMDQMSLMQKYVSERGGGFLALGGYDSLIDGGYEGTPVGAMLPVYLNRTLTDKPVETVRIELTREGMLEPWIRLRPTENQEQERLESMTSFKVLSKVGAPKPGATVLIVAKEESTGEEYPGLAVQRYGKGKTAAMMIGDLWRWQMHDQAATGEQGKAWRQLIRWLIADAPEQIEMTVDRVPADANPFVTIGVRVKDKKFWPMENATVNLGVKSLTLENPREGVDSSIREVASVSNNVVQLVAEPSATEPGLYEAVFVPRQTGGYAVEATVADMNGLTVGRAEAGWSSDPAAEEFRSLNPDRELMERIARQTGGQVVAANDLGKFTKGLPIRQVPVMEEWTSPMWHTAWMFALAIGCFILEWGIRRTRGFA